MDRIRFSDVERKIFFAISKNIDLEKVEGVSIHSKIAALKYLTKKELIKSQINYDKILAVEITSFGIAYLEEYPTLENPPDENMLKELQISKLKYEERIRKQESVIRTWKLITAILGILGLIGWILLIGIKFIK